MNHLNNNNNIKNNQFKYSHLTLNERKIIQTYFNQGKPYQFIANKLGRSKSTIHYEINKNAKRNLPSIHYKRTDIKFLNYNAKYANNSCKNRKNTKKISYSNKQFIALFNSTIENHLSLNQTLLIIQKKFPNLKTPSLKTIYNWFHNKIVFYPNHFKTLKVYKSIIKPSKNNKKSIHQRNFNLNDYSIPGHYEIDTIYDGSRKGGVLTFNHRYDMKLYAHIIPDRKPTTINKHLRKFINQIGSNNIKSITSDNGKEFSYNEVIENSFNLNCFFADPYCSG